MMISKLSVASMLATLVHQRWQKTNARLSKPDVSDPHIMIGYVLIFSETVDARSRFQSFSDYFQSSEWYADE